MTRQDRSLLGFAGAGVLVLLLVIALLSPSADEGNPVPSVDSTGSHGARAAWEMLRRSGRSLQRWDGPLANLPAHVDRETTVVFAAPDPASVAEARPAVQAILARGARVLATGQAGGLLLAPGSMAPPPGGACEPISGGGTPPVMDPEASWKGAEPGLEVLVQCAGNPAVVRFPSGAGEAVWWGGSEPLENRWITEGGNLARLPNRRGSGRRILWVQSLPGGPASLAADIWRAPGAAGALQLGLVGFLLLFSLARRSGPLRSDPVTHRQAQNEFPRALGSLYRRAGAVNEAVATAYDAFRRAAERNTGLPARAALHEAGSRLSVLGRAAEEHFKLAESDGELSAGDALALVQALHGYEAALRAPSDAQANAPKEALAKHSD